MLGFQYLKFAWAGPCIAYLFHPLLKKFLSGKTLSLSGFHARVGTDDFFVLGQIFREYDTRSLLFGLANCDLAIDAGANVGAFGWLAKKLKPSARIVAVEPEQANFQALAGQPFAAQIKSFCAALSTDDQGTFLIKSDHSATHQTTTDSAKGTFIPTVTLQSLVGDAQWVLLKLDIEGAEKKILESGLPDSIHMIIMEWHFPDSPPRLAGGEWTYHGESSYTWLKARPGGAGR